MNLGIFRKLVTVILLGFLLMGQFVQFWWHIILGEEPVISDYNEFSPYLLFSFIIGFGLLLYVKSNRGRKRWLLGVILIQIPVLLFWGLGVIDALEYSRSIYLFAVRIVGIVIPILVVTYSLINLRKTSPVKK